MTNMNIGNMRNGPWLKHGVMLARKKRDIQLERGRGKGVETDRQTDRQTERWHKPSFTVWQETVRQNGNTYYTTRIITDLSSLMEGLIQSRANKQKLSRAQAELTVKRMIAEEEGDEGKHYAEQVQELVNHLITVTLSSYLCLLQWKCFIYICFLCLSRSICSFWV